LLYYSDSDRRKKIDVAEIPQGHYNLVSLEKELKSSIDEKKRWN